MSEEDELVQSIEHPKRARDMMRQPGDGWSAVERMYGAEALMRDGRFVEAARMVAEPTITGPQMAAEEQAAYAAFKVATLELEAASKVVQAKQDAYRKALSRLSAAVAGTAATPSE